MASTRTAIVPFRTATAQPIVVRRSAPRRKGGKRKKPNPKAAAASARTSQLLLGGVASFAFGVLQRRVFTDLPSLPGIPDTLTYGALGAVAGYMLNSPTLIKCSSGLLCTGLNHVGQGGLGVQSTAIQLGGEDEQVSGEEYEQVGASDFGDL